MFPYKEEYEKAVRNLFQFLRGFYTSTSGFPYSAALLLSIPFGILLAKAPQPPNAANPLFQFLLGCYPTSRGSLRLDGLRFQFLLGCYIYFT